MRGFHPGFIEPEVQTGTILLSSPAPDSLHAQAHSPGATSEHR